MAVIGMSGYDLAAVQADEVGARLYDAAEAAILEYGKRCAEVGGVDVIVILLAMAEPTSASHLIAGALARYARQETMARAAAQGGRVGYGKRIRVSPMGV